MHRINPQSGGMVDISFGGELESIEGEDPVLLTDAAQRALQNDDDSLRFRRSH